MTLPTDPTLLLAGGTSPYYQVQRSLRFRRSASAYLNRTPSTAGNRKLWTWSGWVKRGILTTANIGLFSATSGSETLDICFEGNTGAAADSIRFVYYTGAALNGNLVTTPLYRDPSGWYHIVAIWDTDNATSSNRMRIFVNGSEVTAFSTSSYPTLGTSGLINNTVAHAIGRYSNTTSYFDGYLAEVNFIDGQALTPSSFGYSDPTTGVWMPKKYQDAYGTNGFYLTFQDNSAATAAAIGKDWSGVNTNNWTPNNISVTSGVTYDSMIDSPTNYADSGNGRGNYCVVSQVDKNASLSVTNGNLAFSYGSASWIAARGTIGITSGKWYWEFTPTSASSHCNGISTKDSNLADVLGSNASGWGYWQAGYKYNSGSPVLYGATYTTNDVIGVAFDADAGTLTFYKNGVSQGTAFSGLAASTYFPAVSVNAGSCAINFGQRPFSYTPPSGFVALNTQNLSTPTILNGANYMAATLYTGNSANNRAILNGTNNTLGNTFQPDFVWIKDRTGTAVGGAAWHMLFDSIRGGSNNLSSNSTSAEPANAFNTLASFDAGGFTIGTGGNYINANNEPNVAWQWQAGKGSSSIPSGGTITPTGASINTTAGFSVITYTGTGANATVPHGLGAAPNMIIVKARNFVGATDWLVYNSNLTSAAYALILSGTNAQSLSSTYWNSTSPTSSVFSIGTSAAVNNSTTNYVAYCWTAIPGFSAFGSYTGNGSTDGPFVFTGFRPRFIMVKNASASATVWCMWDTSRDTYNLTTNGLQAQSSAAEATAFDVDILANGFKLRDSESSLNGSANTLIYAAFAENPFKMSRAR